MANLRNFKLFGRLDLCASTFQILVTTAITIFSLYFHFKNKKPDGSYRSSHWLLTFVLSIAAIVIHLNCGQLFIARKLMKAGNKVSN